MWKTVRKVLLVAGLLGLGVLIYDAMGKIAWVGSTELMIEFVVTDADTGQPLERAELEVYDEVPARGHDSFFRLTTDSDGRARQERRRMTAGRQSNLRLLYDSRSVNIPSWRIVCAAPGYKRSEPFWLPESTHRHNVERLGPERDRLVVLIALRNSAP